MGFEIVFWGDGSSGSHCLCAATQQHTAIVQSWLQVKIMHYFLTLQLGAYELTQGKTPVPQSVIPAEPVPPSGDLDTPDTRMLYEYMKKVRDEFIASLIE